MTGVTGIRIVSLTLGFLALVLCLVYSGPAEWADLVRPGPQDPLVSAINSLDWLWPSAFLAAGVALIGTVLARHGMIVSHGLAAGVWLAYGLAQTLWALLVEPPAPILGGIISIAAAVVHFGMARAWADQGVR